MAIENGLFIAQVMHARQQPKHHAFVYGVYYLCFALSDMAKLASPLLALNRFNLFSFHEKDHGKRDGSSGELWMRDILKKWNIPQADGRIVLLTLPRVLGYVFNPVSFFFCLDKQNNLRAVLSEVANTFGERHCYLSFHEDRRAITQDDILLTEKIFHVSPFMKVKGHYLFRFAYGEKNLGVWIDYYDENGHLLATSLSGKRVPLTTKNLLRCFFRYPLVTLKVISLIHFEAVRLLIKGIKYQPKPTPPTSEISQ